MFDMFMYVSPSSVMNSKVQVNVVGNNLLITFSKMSPYLLNQKQEVLDH